MQATKTLAAINAALEAEQKIEFRRHLGASVVGRPCSRQIFYIWRWAKFEKHEGRMLRLFARGQNEEERFFEYLRSIGCEVWPFNEAAGKKKGKPQQWRVSDVEGHFGGSLDGVGRGIPDLPPGTPFLIECKTHNLKSFTKLKEEGLMKAKWEHFIQMQTYIHKMGLPAGLYMASCKDNDELFLDIVQPDPEQAKRTIDRGRMIIYAKEAPPRINKSPGFWMCKFCTFQQMCHFKNEQPHRNCRTCKFSVPLKDGSGDWHCTHGNGHTLNEAAQLAGCGHYDVNLGLFSEP